MSRFHPQNELSRLRPFRKSERGLSASRLETLRKASAASQLVNTTGLQGVMVDSDGVHHRTINTTPAVGIQAAHFRVRSSHANYVRGWRITNEDTGVPGQFADEWLIAEDVPLAKPPSLRKKEYEAELWGLVTWAFAGADKRTAMDGTDTEEQLIIPRLLEPQGTFLGKNVFAVKGIMSGTGVSPVDLGGPELVPVEWEIVGQFAFTKKDDS